MSIVTPEPKTDPSGSRLSSRLHVGPTALAVAFAAQLTISLLIVLSACLGLTGNPPPVWSGIIDVLLVLTLLITGSRLNQLVRGATQLRSLLVAYKLGVGLFALTLVGFWISAGRVDLNILLPGLTWRVAVLLWVLPSIVAIAHRESPGPVSRARGQ